MSEIKKQLALLQAAAEKTKAPPRDGLPPVTLRQHNYLDRLTKSKGKRLLVDLGPQANADLETLLAGKYGATQREVVERALGEAAKREQRKKPKTAEEKP